MSDEKLKKLKIWLWVLVVLLALALGFVYKFWSQKQTQEIEKTDLSSRLTELDRQKLSLEDELAGLEAIYSEQLDENESLSDMLESKLSEIGVLQDRITRLRSQLVKSESFNAEISERLARLEELRSTLEGDLSRLIDENEELRSFNNQMAVDLAATKEVVFTLRDDVDVLGQRNEDLISRLFRLAPAGYVADNIRVQAERRNEKITVRAGRTSRIKVSFDLRNVPPDRHGSQELYLVITSFDGNPVAEIPSTPVQIRGGQSTQIAAADIRAISLGAQQSIEMGFTPGRRFGSGVYHALIYANHGFLGASSFELL